ncbi:hypothetical protein M3P36_04865 [Altererythrobacter sp. KTW20L]|uniref:hypothetical protein n=1 Tax=Altererythrobacter sp. KTW20L TaxID=2942210 RepID=UPI0020BD91C7|nr:hypothetical protein [Altererythrobacter sp. KTW20L]MCL6250380.1 hypothetical protein [Altererythrobacter sp. KTW20L]
MKEFFRSISPRRAAQDLITVWQEPNRHRWPVLGLALAITFSLFMLFIPDDYRTQPAAPEIIFISTYEDNRTEQEIIASNCRNQELKDAMQARLDARAELRREMYIALGRATFLDVDKMVEEAEANRAAAEAEAAANAPEPTPEQLVTVEEYCARALG